MKSDWISTGVYVVIAWTVYFVGELSNDSAVSMLLMLGYMVVLLAGAIALIVRLIMNIAYKRRVLAVLAMMAAVLPFCCMPEIRELHARAGDFFLRDERMAVIKEIRAGELKADDYGIVRLPEDRKRLSHDGEVRVLEAGEQTTALFYNEQYILAGADVTVWCPDMNPPTEELLDAWEIFSCKSLGDGWYYVSYD